MPTRSAFRRCLPLLLTFGASHALADTACSGSEQPATRLFLQQVTATGAILRWRGDATAVCIGREPGRLEVRVAAASEGGHRQAKLTGLEPDTLYYYLLVLATCAGDGPISP